MGCAYCGGAIYGATETCSAVCRDMLKVRRSGETNHVRSPAEEVEHQGRIMNSLAPGWGDEPVADAMFSDGIPREVQTADLYAPAYAATSKLTPAWAFPAFLVAALLVVLGLALLIGVHR